MNMEVKSVAGGAVTLRLNFAQLGDDMPNLSFTSFTASADKSIADLTSQLKSLEGAYPCKVKAYPTAYPATSKGTNDAPNIAAPFVFTCNPYGQAIKSVRHKPPWRRCMRHAHGPAVCGTAQHAPRPSPWLTTLAEPPLTPPKNPQRARRSRSSPRAPPRPPAPA